VKLDLGSGRKPMEGFLGVDSVPGITDFVVDLWRDGAPWPFADDSVDELWSNHFIEHIDAVDVPVWRKVRAIASDDSPWTPFVEGYEISGGYLWQRTEERRDALFHFFSEAFRIAKPGATFTVVWPCVQSRPAYRDPTHRRFIDTEVVHYLSRAGRKTLDVEHYDIDCNWVGTATDIVRRDPNGEAPTEEALTELRRRAKTEWNVAEESMMQLVAEKGTA
jgi:hypothetical protein